MNAAKSPSRRPGRPRDEAVRRRILSAARDLLEEVGFAQVTCEAIADCSGTSKTTIYRWWPNKAAVLLDAFVEAVSPELPAGYPDSLEEYMVSHLRQFTRVLMGRSGRLLAAILAAAQHDPDVEAALVSHWIGPRRARARRAMRRYQAEGQLDASIDIDQALDSLYGPLYFLLMVRHRKLTLAYADNLARTLLAGFAPRTVPGS